MLTHSYIVFRNLLAIVVLAAGQGLVFASISLAQDEGLSFEQAQTRTAFARTQMQAARLALKDAESHEEASLRQVAELQKRLEEAQKNVVKLTAERQTAETKHEQAKDRWSLESDRLKRIHQRHDIDNPVR